MCSCYTFEKILKQAFDRQTDRWKDGYNNDKGQNHYL